MRASKRHASTSGYSGSDIAVMAVSMIGGAGKFVHTEDVAMKAAELAPRRFSWKRYPEQVNLEAVRLSLKDELAKEDARIQGGIRIGWMLSPQGVSYCVSVLDSESKSKLENYLRRVAEEAKRTSTIQLLLDGDLRVPDRMQLRELLRVDEYSTTRSRLERSAALDNAALIDTDLNTALVSLRDRGISLRGIQHD